MKDKVAVTGGAGFIGSHLVEALLRKGHRVTVIDNFSEGRMSNLYGCRRNRLLTIVRMDVRDPRIFRVLRGATAVYHLAALVGAQRSQGNPKEANEINVDGTLNLLIASEENRVDRFVFASSASVYGSNNSSIQKETMRPNPATTYSASKLAGENYCNVFHENHSLSTVSLRFFNVYGPRQRSGPYSSVITSFGQRILAKKPPIIFGSGKQTRDFVFVSDVVQALLLSLNNEKADGRTINIGTGRPTSINKLARLIIRQIGRNRYPIFRRPAKEGDILHSCADLTLAKESLSYSPKVELKDGLRTTFGHLSNMRRVSSATD